MLIFRDFVEQALQTLFRAMQFFVKMLILILLLHHLLAQNVVFFAQALAEPNELGYFLFQAFKLAIHRAIL